MDGRLSRVAIVEFGQVNRGVLLVYVILVLAVVDVDVKVSADWETSPPSYPTGSAFPYDTSPEAPLFRGTLTRSRYQQILPCRPHTELVSLCPPSLI